MYLNLPAKEPFLARLLLVVRRGVLLPWLLCPHRPFLPAIGTVKHPRDIPPSRLCPSCHHVVMRDVSDKPTLYLALACCLLLKVLSGTVQVVW